MQEALRVADDAHHALSAMPILLRSEPVTLSCTIGIAVMPRDGTTAGELFSAADRRLYRGKQRGRRCTVAEDMGRTGRT
jgi:diguanylate cyclase (GGDEF)-like protein